MTSSINPLNIDGTFPVVGVSNNSQGFRDNFTNIKTNLTTAKNEIEDLQSRSVFTRDGTAAPITNDMLGSTISNVYFKGASDVVIDHNTQTGPVTLSFSEGSYHKITTNGPIVLDLDWTGLNNLIPSYGVMYVEMQVTSMLHTITFPVEVTFGNSKVPLSTLNIFSPPTAHETEDAGNYLFKLSTTNAGNAVRISLE